MAHKFFLLILAAVLLFGFTSCRTVRVIEQVPVEVHDTTYITHTEFVVKTDTLINNTETIVRVANAGDSALLAKLGLQLKDNERTILVLRNELSQMIKQIELSKYDSTYMHNDTPVTVSKTETVEVEKPLRWWQKGLMWAGAIGIFVAALAIVIRLRR